MQLCSSGEFARDSLKLTVPRYLLRAPLSLERTQIEEGSLIYRHKRPLQPMGEIFDARSGNGASVRVGVLASRGKWA